jgi:hypothetical protein
MWLLLFWMPFFCLQGSLTCLHDVILETRVMRIGFAGWHSPLRCMCFRSSLSPVYREQIILLLLHKYCIFFVLELLPRLFEIARRNCEHGCLRKVLLCAVALWFARGRRQSILTPPSLHRTSTNWIYQGVKKYWMSKKFSMRHQNSETDITHKAPSVFLVAAITLDTEECSSSLIKIT